MLGTRCTDLSASWNSSCLIVQMCTISDAQVTQEQSLSCALQLTWCQHHLLCWSRLRVCVCLQKMLDKLRAKKNWKAPWVAGWEQQGRLHEVWNPWASSAWGWGTCNKTHLGPSHSTEHYSRSATALNRDDWVKILSTYLLVLKGDHNFFYVYKTLPNKGFSNTWICTMWFKVPAIKHLKVWSKWNFCTAFGSSVVFQSRIPELQIRSK